MKAPLLSISDWVQGEPVNLDQLSGRVVLIEVFQVNCPGCFLYALPKAIDLYNRYSDKDLTILGVATAFEDFDKNNLENLSLLIEKGEVIGETFKVLSQQGKLVDGHLPFELPFSIAMDRLQKRKSPASENQITNFIKQRITNFNSKPKNYQQHVRTQVQDYFQSLTYHAETFELFNLKGTPSHILVDKQGVLRECIFGNESDLENKILVLLRE